MSKRFCVSCKEYMPPETTHFREENSGDVHCENCLKVVPYTAYMYYDMSENYIGSEDEFVKVEDYEDEYEEDEE